MLLVCQNKIEPIIKELYRIIPSRFYLSTHFQKCCIKEGIEDDWERAMKMAEDNRGYISMGIGINDKETDANEAVKLTCNIAFHNGTTSLLRYVIFLLDSFQSSADNISINPEELIDCFKLIGLSDTDCQKLRKYDKFGILTDMDSPKNILNDAERLNNLKNEIDKAIKKGEYNKANTYSYTLLEGVLKGYLTHFNITFNKNEDIEKLPKFIKDDVKQRLGNHFINASHVSKQISVITHIVSDLRNHESDSHYARISDHTTACFVRDLTLALANLLLNIIK